MLAALDAGRPAALINRTVPGLRCDQVASNNHAMSHRIAEYFAEAGHTTVGLVTADQSSSTADLRAGGFRAGVEDTGMELPRSLVEDGAFSHAGGYRAFLSMMSLPRRPTAIFCVNDLSAMGALDAARSLGVRVPEDLWLAGYDDIDMASWEAFSLSTAKQPIDAMVTLAVDLLLSRIEQPTLPFRHYQIPATLNVRGSTGWTPFAGGAPPASSEPVLLSE